MILEKDNRSSMKHRKEHKYKMKLRLEAPVAILDELYKANEIDHEALMSILGNVIAGTMTQTGKTDMTYCIKDHWGKRDVCNGIIRMAGDGYLEEIEAPDGFIVKPTKKLVDWLRQHFYKLTYRYQRIHPYWISDEYIIPSRKTLARTLNRKLYIKKSS